jgi:hypothetical protein
MRKPLLATDLDLPTALPGQAKPPAPFHETAPQVAEQPAPAGGIKGKAIASTFYLLPEDHRRLRRLAADRGVAAQTILQDALDAVFAAAGEPPVTRWEPRRKTR